MLTTPWRRGRSRDRGQALAEFALVAPILFLLLFGVLQMGLLFGGQNGLVNGVREAARRAVTYRVNEASLSDTGILAAVCSAVEDELNTQLGRALPGFDPLRMTRTVSYHWESNPGPAPTGPNPEDSFLYVQVDVAYNHPLYVPLVGLIIDTFDWNTPSPNTRGEVLANPLSGDGAFTLTASEQMRIENPPLAAGTTPPACT